MTEGTYLAPKLNLSCFQASERGVQVIAIKCPLNVSKEDSSEAAIHYKGTANLKLTYKKELMLVDAADALPSRKCKQRTAVKRHKE
jgi:hypothetical protein